MEKEVNQGGNNGGTTAATATVVFTAECVCSNRNLISFNLSDIIQCRCHPTPGNAGQLAT